MCSFCGWKNPNLTLKDREFKCQEYGVVVVLVYNAAQNILKESLNIINDLHRRFFSGNLRLRWLEFTLVDYHPTGEPTGNSVLKSRGRLLLNELRYRDKLK